MVKIGPYLSAKAPNLKWGKYWEVLSRLMKIEGVNFVLAVVLFFQLKWNILVLECFGVSFWNCIVHIYINKFNKHNLNSR
jgi:hypothetical protein